MLCYAMHMIICYDCPIITGCTLYLPGAETTFSANYKTGPVVKVLYLGH